LFNIHTVGQNIPTWISPCFHCDNILVSPIDEWGLLLQSSISIKHDKNFRTEFNLQSRIMNQIKSVKAVMGELGIRNKFNKYFSFKTAFRLTRTPSNYDYYYKGDAYLNISYYRLLIAGYFNWRKKEFPIRFQLRTRLEKEGRKYQEVANGEYFWRNRIKIAVNMSKVVDPYISIESFEQIKRYGKLHSKRFPVDIYRYEAGLKWKLSKSVDLISIFRYEYYHGNSVTTSYRIIGVIVDFTF